MKNSAGLHLILDGYVSDSAVFNRDALRDLFVQLAAALEMKIIMGPEFLEVELDPSKLQSDVFQDEGGITGMCVISTSHMSIHCWPIRKCFSMDVFSCKNFSATTAVSLIKDKLGVTEATIFDVDRYFPTR
jgi:S-adenosylmethionine/arginine decarboxylase-like enzyme